MLRMDQVYVIRHKVLTEGRSIREVARELGVSRNTIRRYLDGAEPGKRKASPRRRPVSEKVRQRFEELAADSPRWTGGKQRLTRKPAARDQVCFLDGHLRAFA